MKVLMTGATGSIGVAVTAEMLGHGHQVLALARSAASEATLRRRGCDVVRGDLRRPGDWAHAVRSVDAVITLGDTFTSDMDQIDRDVIAALIDAAGAPDRPIRFVYTGGCWMYGATGDRVATEETPFDAVPAYDWAVAGAARLQAAPAFAAAILHPAMVYHRSGGVLGRFLDSARSGEAAEIWGDPATRWPLIHRDDLAVAYRVLAERPDLTGAYNAVAEQGVAVGVIVRAIYAGMGAPLTIKTRDMASVVAEQGDWAEGAFLDQQMACPRLIRDTGWRAKITDFRASDLFSPPGA